LVTHTGTLTLQQQLWVAVLSVGGGAVVAGLAAAVEGGLRGFRAEPIDLLVRPDRTNTDARRRLKPGMPGVRVHRTGALPDEHVQAGRCGRRRRGRWSTPPNGRAAMTRRGPPIIAAGCQQGRVTPPEEILAVVQRMPRARRRGLVIETARYAQGGAEALSEIDFVQLCRRYRLPLPDLQTRRQDASGRVRYLDAYWREFGLHVEVDGAHHMDVRHWEADMRRQNDLWIKGDRVLRFPAWAVRHHPVETAGQLRQALEAVGWHPTQ
jgi:very-short-patch-repair endonuclease